jgi:hypothetical protein
LSFSGTTGAGCACGAGAIDGGATAIGVGIAGSRVADGVIGDGPPSGPGGGIDGPGGKCGSCCIADGG